MQDVALVGDDEGLRENHLDGPAFEVGDILIGRDFPILSKEVGKNAITRIDFGERIVSACFLLVALFSARTDSVRAGRAAVFFACSTSLVAGELLNDSDQPTVEFRVVIAVQRADGHVADVKHLKGRLAHGPVVDDSTGVGGKGGSRVDETLPANRAAAEALGMLLIKERFRFPIASLLPEKGCDGGTAVVIDAGGGVEGEFVAGIQQAPTDVDIIPCSVEALIEAAYL